MEETARRLATAGWLLRSGGAQGADEAFERGANMAAEIFLPWPGFRGRRQARLLEPTSGAYEIAAAHHAAWADLSQYARALLARDVHQVLGADLDDQVAMVVCWTTDGATTADETSRRTGGTAMAIRVAGAYGVPVRNLGRADDRAALEAYLSRAKTSVHDGTQR